MTTLDKHLLEQIERDGHAMAPLETICETFEHRVAELDTEIRAGFTSGDATPMTADDWQALRHEVSQRLGGGAIHTAPQHIPPRALPAVVRLHPLAQHDVLTCALAEGHSETAGRFLQAVEHTCAQLLHCGDGHEPAFQTPSKKFS